MSCLQCKPFFTADMHDLVTLQIIASVSVSCIAEAYNRGDVIISSPCRHETDICREVIRHPGQLSVDIPSMYRCI